MIQTSCRLSALFLLGVFVVTCEMNEHIFNDAQSNEATDHDDSAERTDTGGDGDADLDAESTAAEMGVGTGIANSLDNTAAWETGWGQPVITQAFIEGLARNGLKTARLPVAWNAYAVDGIIQEEKMARVREVVEWILAAGMYCIVDIHWDDGWISSEGTNFAYTLTDAVRTLYQSYWQQIAAAFSDVGSHLLFESLNDESFYVDGDSAGTPDAAPINELNQTFVNTVRAAGGANDTRNLIIAGFGAKIEETCVDEFAIPTDPAGSNRLLLSVHYYTPYPFTQMMESGEWEGVWTDPRTTWGTDEDLAELQTVMDLAAAFGVERNVPVVISEFAVLSTLGSAVREPASRALWMKRVMETALSLKMAPILWDYGTDINRTDGSFSTEFSEAVSELGL